MLEVVTVLLAGAAAALLGVRVVVAAAWMRQAECVRLVFPRSVTPEQATAALRSLRGLLPAPLPGLIVRPTVIFEIVATEQGIEHYVSVPAGRVSFVLGQLRAAIPGLRAMSASTPKRRVDLARELHVAGAGELRLGGSAESSAALLAALQPLRAGELVLVQWSVGPMAPPPRWLRQLDGWRAETAPGAPVESEPPLRAVCRVGVRSQHPAAVMARVVGALHAADTPERGVVRRLWPAGLVASRLARAAAAVLTRSVVGGDELAAVLGLPLGGPQLEGLTLSGSRMLAPAATVVRAGRVLGDALIGGHPVAITEDESRKGLLVTAPTGAGKSTVLEHLCAADFAAGRGVIVIESKTDLCGALAELVPRSRIDEAIVFNPADSRPCGFNLLGGGEAAADLITDHVVGQFRTLYAGYLGPRSEMLLRAALLTLSRASGEWTICEVMPVLSQARLRRRLMASLDDHALEAVWAWFDAQTPAAQSEMTSPLANKLAAFTLRRQLRAVVGQARSAIDFDAALRERRILLISLAKALIGEDAAALLGSCLLAELWAAVQRRAALPPKERRFVSVVLDEAQDFLRLPVALGDAVAQSRGMGVGWTVAHQNLGQLSPELRAAVLANLRSKLVMQTTADDARAFAREFSPHLAADDLQGLPAFEGYAAISAGASVAPPASIATRPPLGPLGHGNQVRARSRRCYGADPAEVESALRARLADDVPDAPVGSRRRG